MSLISVAELARRLDDPDVRIVDVRWYLGKPGQGRANYGEGHLPGAIYLDLDTDLADRTQPAAGRHPLPDPAEFARRLGERGIGAGDLVVAYDDVGGWVAARLWWMLDNLGHTRVSVLDGGMQAWVAAGHPLSSDLPASRPPVRLELADHWSNTIDRDGLRDRLGSVVLLDVRAAPRYRGEVEPVDPVAGHIPTAVNVPLDGNLVAPAGAFLEPAALRERYDALGAAGSRDVVTSCGSGTSACHTSLSMRLAGLPDPILYVGSWSDWSTAGYPVATGPDPGEPPTTSG